MGGFGAGSSQQPTGRENRRNPEEAQASEASAKEEDTGKKKTSLTLRKELWEPERFSPLSRIKERLWALSGLLHQKGIGKRERILIGAGALLAVIFVILIGRLAGNALERSRKSQNVTADSGLTVTVEEQPEEWCSSAQITLGVSAGDTPVTQVIIDGETYEPDENGQIRFTAEDYLVDAQAVTADGSLNARIEIPMIDWDPPSVTASLVEDQIEITAQDARSAVDKIYYAAVRPGEFLSIPYYQEYTQPFAYESGMVYYFYAQDQAGNKSIPCSTTMEKAESLVLNETELNLFIGDSVSLGVTAQPEGALLEHLTFESMNPELLEVSENGKVTALAAGTGAVRVQADGVESAVCTVDVQEERTVTITALGDCTLGTDENFNTSTSFNAFDTVNGHSYFFQNVRDILENDDATFANLEGTLTTETARESKEYAFKGDPSYTEILTDGSIEVVTLANNHSSDYGAQSLTDTETYLSEAGIDYCTGDTIAVQELNGVRTAFIGIYVLADGMGREEQVRQTIAQAQEQGAQLIVMAFHWGSEKQTAPDETQQSLAHIAVDCGADLVVGHHPHVLQGIEKYNGKYIVYSLGNFCFGGNSAPSDMDTIIFRQTFTIDEGEVQSDDQAVMQMNSEDGGKRRFIMVQLPEETLPDSEAYKNGYKNICEIGKDRIRKAGAKIKESSPGCKDLDTGFRVFRLSDSNMADVYYSADMYDQSMLAGLESNIKPDRRDIDLLFGCLLEWGLPLTMPYISEEIDGCTVHTYNNGDLIACFEEDVPDSVIRTIAARRPLRAVFCDGSFADSAAKINVEEIFKLSAPDTRVKVI